MFDRKYKFKYGDYKRVSAAGREYGQDGAHEKLDTELTITEAGYVYLFLSNDNVALGGGQVEVYFDDFKVEHIKSPVIQSDDYYPFGAVFNSYSRENSLPNNWLYQSKEWENDLSLGLYDSEWRQYDPWGVRTTTMDPHGESYPSLSPYSWAANNPLSIIDPDGQDIVDNALGTTYTGTDAQNAFRQLQSQQSSRNSSSKKDPDKPAFYSFNSRTQARREQMVAEAEERDKKDQPGFWAGAGDASMDFLGNIGGLFTGSTYPKIWEGIKHQWRRNTDMGYNTWHTVVEMNHYSDFIEGNLSSYQYGYSTASTTLQYGSVFVPGLAGAGWSRLGALAYGSETFGIGSKLFGIGRNGFAKGSLNSGSFRIGWGYMKAGNQHVFRIGIGSNPRFYQATKFLGTGIHWHVNIFNVPAKF